MAVAINEVGVLKDYFFRVVERSEHQIPNVNEIIYPLLGFIVLSMDDKSDIQVRGSDETTGNMLWLTINGQRYAFRYEQDEDAIVIRKGNFQGEVVAKVNNATSINNLKQVFAKL